MTAYGYDVESSLKSFHNIPETRVALGALAAELETYVLCQHARCVHGIWPLWSRVAAVVPVVPGVPPWPPEVHIKPAIEHTQNITHTNTRSRAHMHVHLHTHTIRTPQQDANANVKCTRTHRHAFPHVGVHTPRWIKRNLHLATSS